MIKELPKMINWCKYGASLSRFLESYYIQNGNTLYFDSIKERVREI